VLKRSGCPNAFFFFYFYLCSYRYNDITIIIIIIIAVAVVAAGIVFLFYLFDTILWAKLSSLRPFPVPDFGLVTQFIWRSLFPHFFF